MKLAFVGDVMIGRLVNDALKNLPPEYLWGDTLNTLLEVDARFCNLECVISDKGSPWSKTPKIFHFRSDAENINVLEAGRIDAVSLANNHSLDYGAEALVDMLSILNNKNIFYVGAGKNNREARQPAILEVSGNKIGFVACTDNEPEWEATPAKPGVHYVPIDLDDRRTKKLLDLIRQTKKKVQILIASIHWGPNWGYDVPQDHIDFAHASIDAGVDIVFGHSPHVFRGIEIYKNQPIFYSCGNFIDDYAVDEVERNDQSFIFTVEILPNGRISNIVLRPTMIENFQARLATPEEASLFVPKMQNLCEALNTRATWEEDGLLKIG